jgi:hypothetical protein
MQQLDKMQKTTAFKNFEKIKLNESGNDYNPVFGSAFDLTKRKMMQKRIVPGEAIAGNADNHKMIKMLPAQSAT